MDHDAYLRFPTLHGDTIAFVADDDLWSVPTTGGLARRLTAGLSEPSTPCLSPDGKWIAFIGRDEQHAEVYLMAAEGGPAKRLTWLGPDTIVRGWTPEGLIVFVSTHGQPFFRNYRAFTLDPAGGLPQLLPLGQVNHLAWGPAGARVIGRNTADPARWKRYRGGTAGHLWIDAEGGGTYRRMTELRGNITSPMWLGGRIYHVSDFEGMGELYSCLPDGTNLHRHTDHADHGDFYVRHAQTDGQRIVYQCGAQVWLHTPDGLNAGHNTRVEIRTPAHRTQAARKFVPAGEHLGGFNVHPLGHSVAIEARGKLFTMALWEGAVRQHEDEASDTSDTADIARLEPRIRLGQWLDDGTTLVAVSDAASEERITVFEHPQTRALPWDVGHVTALRAAPRGSAVAIANHRNQVLIGDLASGVLTLVDASDAGRSDDLAWSADGTWLAYSFQTSHRHTAIKLHQLGSGISTLVTRPEFRDYSPSFDPQGKYLYFLSLRTFDPVYDSVQFEMSFPRAARPYLIALQAGGAPPFEPAPKGLKGPLKAPVPSVPNHPTPVDADTATHPAGPPAAATPATADAPPASAAALLRVDLPGIAARIAAFPVNESRFGRVVGAASGKVVWSVLGIVGAHGRGGHKEAPGRLEVFDFATLHTETLTDKADHFELAADHTTLVLREGKRLRALAIDPKPPSGDDAAPGAPPSRKSGWLDLERLRISVEPMREWRQMLGEVWRLQRDQFWAANMSGVDWPGVYARYAPLLAQVATRGELSDLIWEMQGELGTSHAYESGGDHRKPPAVALGFLGAELRFDARDSSYEITALVTGDAWDAGADSPLNAVGVEAKLGERIVRVNGQRVSAQRPPQALLVNQANAKVELTLTLTSPMAAGAAASDTSRTVLITTLGDEVPARYREWVETNRAWVHAQSNGRVGYLHLPDMMAAGFAEFQRYFSTECDRAALIVDVRYNRGGHVSALLLEKIARKRIGQAVTRWGRPAPYPDESAAGPVVALTNEHAGSDGDIFSHSFKLMNLGPLVGTRTWGGVVGIWPRHLLVDGTTTTQPEFAYWFTDVGFAIENHGTDPQIEIDNAPQDTAAGRDRQLEVALTTALAEIDRHATPA